MKYIVYISRRHLKRILFHVFQNKIMNKNNIPFRPRNNLERTVLRAYKVSY